MSLPVKPDYFDLMIWTDVPADPCVPGSYSHPGNVIWQYKAKDYDEVLVGYDKHPEEPTGQPGREPVFRYSVRIDDPNDWFDQNDVNGIYWLSVMAVYDVNRPNYDWGWTNHKHVFQDDAAAWEMDPTGLWRWVPLEDQTGETEDMSFILFTKPILDCLIGGIAGPKEYTDWVAWGKPNCWCYCRQCRGDIDGIKIGPFWVQALDLAIFRAAFGKNDAALALVPNGICADLDHLKIGPFRVQALDLAILRTYFGKAAVPNCATPPIYTGPYNFWCDPTGCPRVCP
jgi:hypothetical protein